MAVKEVPVKSFQGYSIVKIVETGPRGELVIETFALGHEAGGIFAEFASIDDAIRELNRMLFPLPGLPVECSRQAV